MIRWRRVGRDAAHPAGIARWARNNGLLLVWCDGTRSPREWRWNFMTRRITLGHGFVRVNERDYAQALDVLKELMASGALDGVSAIHAAGFSRGGAVAWVVAWLLYDIWPTTTHSWAGKRTGNRALRRDIAQSTDAWRGDVVPWAPPWYAAAEVRWHGRLTWPWRAHLAAARTAARWRHAP